MKDTDSAAWVAGRMNGLPVTKELILSAVRHVSPAFVKDIFSTDLAKKSIAKGYFYEATAYEMLLRVRSRSDQIRYVVRKGGDVPKQYYTKPALGQNGLFYSPLGEMKIRGNGIDLAEIDLLMVDANGELVFAECKLSGKSLTDEFTEEIEFKRQILEYCFGTRAHLVLVSTKDIRDKPMVKTLSMPHSSFVRTGGFDALLDSLTREEVNGAAKRRPEAEGLVFWTDLKPKITLNYVKLHDSLREKILAGVNGRRPVEGMSEEESFIKNVLIGSLDDRAVDSLFAGRGLSIDSLRLTRDSIGRSFSKIVLGLSMPEMRPSLYMRVKGRPAYVKLGPYTMTEFGFERLIWHYYTPFCTWLDNVSSPVGPDYLEGMLRYFMKKEITGARAKKGIPRKQLSKVLRVNLKK